MPGSIGPMEVILVLAIALIVLGPKKLPEVGRSIGKGIREFRQTIGGEKERFDAALDFEDDDEPRRVRAKS